MVRTKQLNDRNHVLTGVGVNAQSKPILFLTLLYIAISIYKQDLCQNIREIQGRTADADKEFGVNSWGREIMLADLLVKYMGHLLLKKASF